MASPFYGNQLSTLSQLPQGSTQKGILAGCPSLSIATGTIRRGDGAFCLHLSSSELSGGGSKEEPIGTQSSCLGARRAI